MRRLRPLILVAIAALAALAALGGAGLAVATASQTGTSTARQCGFVRASVPYSHHGRHDRWRVYVRGNAGCAAARGALNAVMHLNAKVHNGSNNADSYFSYRGWTCDFGQMGFESCIRPRHQPYTAGALAIDCQIASNGCPAKLPADDVPGVVAAAVGGR